MSSSLSEYLNLIVAHNLNNRPPCGPGASLQSYARENCTVTLGTFRQAGHTRAIVDLASQFRRALVLGPSLAWMERILPLSTGATALLTGAFSADAVRGLELDIIIIDDASTATPDELKAWYDPVVLECFFRTSPLYV